MSLATRLPVAMYDTILVPTDGSDHARRAAEHAALLAGALDATVHVVSVVDLDDAAGPFSAGGLDDHDIDRLTASGRSTAEETAAALGERVTVETDVLTGRPSDAILDYVEDHGVDLVCMGTHGRRGLSRYLTGSVAERVLRRAPVPVMTVRASEGRAAGAYDEILVPTDGSDRAEAAVAHALAIGEQFDSRIHAVSVVNVGDLATGSEMGLPEHLLEELKSAADSATEAVVRRAEGAGLDAVSTTSVGRPKTDLLAYIEDHDVDLVCMGTHGRTGLDRVLVGSTAEALVRKSAVPVLTVS